MKSFLVIAALIFTSFQNIVETPACNVEHLRKFNHDYLHKPVQEHNSNPTASISFNSLVNGKEGLGDKIVFTTEILQHPQYRAQLLAHFNNIMSKNLRMTQNEIIAGIN